MEDSARRLLMLSLALEDALARESWSEADSVFVQRGRLLQKMAGLQPSPEADELLKTVQAVEGRILGRLAEARSSVAASIRSQVQGRQAASAYRPAIREPVSLDRAG